MSEYTYKRTNHIDGSVLSEQWFENDKWHRDNDKPAIIYYNEDGSVLSEQWFENDKCHRDNDKPAIIQYRKDGSVSLEYWFKEGVQYTPHADT